MVLRLGELLVKRGRLDSDQLDRALKVQREKGGRLGKILVGLGYLSEKQILDALSQQFDMPVVPFEEFQVDENAAKLLPPNMIRRHNIVPLGIQGNTLTIAAIDPTDVFIAKDISLYTGFKVDLVLASETAVNKAIEGFYERSHAVELQKVVEDIGYDEVASMQVLEEEQAQDVATLEAEAKQPPVVKMVTLMMTDAVVRGASDIHIEPYENEVRVRFRIDGILHEMIKIAHKYKDPIVSRIKVLAKMDIAEKRLPQDGRIKIKMRLQGLVRDLDLRVSVLPTIFGEKVVIRILDKEGLMLDMSMLGLETQSLHHFEKAIFQPWGMVLVTGPTGSGKTNTLYSAISRLNTPDVNIVTVEDPVEFNLRGINQVNIQEGIGLSFAGVLRSFLRQDPNIMLVGEVRDNETAEIAVKAALTGHLVLSTLHTNDAPSAIFRLLNMNIEPILICSSVLVMCAQRLVRRICQECKEPVDMPTQALLNIGFTEKDLETLTVYSGKGCKNCNYTGYKGRIGLFEVMPLTTGIKELILSGGSILDIKQKAEEEDMLTLRQSGLKKIQAGITSIEEVLRETTF
jgi:type IV pilus assembly protein PilB